MTLGKNFVLDSEAYADVKVFEREIRGLEKYPKILGPLDELKKSNLYHVHEESIYHNSCPHRGARLNKTEQGFVCSYHGWKFDSKGKLTESTGPRCPYPAGALKLKKLNTVNLGGMIFTGMSTYAKEINALASNGHYVETRSKYVYCNWKFLAESLLETYHFPFAHSNFLSSFDNAFYSKGSNLEKDARIIVPLSDFQINCYEDNLKGINIMYYIFPYSFVLFMSSGFVWFKITPKSVDQSLFEYFLFSYNKDELVARQSFEVLSIILEEDFDVLEGQQKNAALLRQRYHFTGYETLIRHMHDCLKPF